MKNITLSVADETYRQARIWAAENNISISAAVQYVLDHLREILRVRKPPRQARRNNRFLAPPAEEMSREEVMMLVSRMESEVSLGRSHRGSEISHL
jgi:hypothetical protein